MYAWKHNARRWWSVLALLVIRQWSPFANVGVVVVVAVAAAASSSSSGSVVTVYTNAKIYTVHAAAPWAEALTVSADGVILAVGTTDQAVSAAEQAAGAADYEVVDLQQRLVLPGFHDVHLHAVEAGINAQLCSMEDTVRSADLANRLKSCKNQASFGGAGWIVGVGPE